MRRRGALSEPVGYGRSGLGAPTEIGIYAMAILLHLPLVLAAQHLGGSLAPTPRAPSIDLVSLPHTGTLSPVRPQNGKGAIADLQATRLGELPSSASTVPGIAETQPLRPIEASRLSASGSLPTAAPTARHDTTRRQTTKADVVPSVDEFAAVAAISPGVRVSAVDEPLSSSATVAEVAETPRSDDPGPATKPEMPSPLRPVATDAWPPGTPAMAAVPPDRLASRRLAGSTETPAAALPIEPPIGRKPSVATTSIRPADPAAAARPSPSTAQVAASTVGETAAAAVPGVSTARTAPLSPRSMAGSAAATSLATQPTIPAASTTPGIASSVKVKAVRITAPLAASPGIIGGAGAEAGLTEPAASQGDGFAPGATRLVSVVPSEASAAGIGRTGAGRAVQDFLRGYSGSGCFIAVASQVAADTFAVSGFSRTETEWSQFNRSLDESTGYRFAQRSRQVSQAQCAALAFARAQPAYPAFATRISLTSDRLKSGAEIAGRVEAPPEGSLTFLLVDDEGLVQDVTALLRRETDGSLTFRTPLTLTAGPVATVQLFVALVGGAPIAAVPANGTLNAKDYFARLGASTAGGFDVAVAAFSVEE